MSFSFLLTTFAVAIYLLLLFAAQRILDSGRRALTVEQKAKVMDVSATLRSASILPPIALVLLFGFAADRWPEHFHAVMVVVYVLLIATSALFSATRYRRIRLLDLPRSYLQRLLASQILYIVALVFICGFLSAYYAAWIQN